MSSVEKTTFGIIGVGGIFTAADVWEKITAGASLVQIYTALVYEGPSIAADIVRALALAAVPALWMLGVLEIWQLVAIAFVVVTIAMVLSAILVWALGPETRMLP